jgi:ATP-dependent RNA helicase DDX54/DBP10
MKETGMTLSHVEVIVYDEADRIFEMGFAEDVHTITEKMPKHWQSMLFSATLPPSLADFTLSGIREYKLLKLDHEHKLSDDLKINFYFARSPDKVAALLFLLTEVMHREETTIIFAATRYHVEYLSAILTSGGYWNAMVYGTLDQVSRQIAL